jgi:hypothetical protein
MNMGNKQLFKYGFEWGFLLWLFGYILSIGLFMVMPFAVMGWVITPIASVFTIWILFKKIKLHSVQKYILLGSIWTGIAIILDYLLIVKAFDPADGYYKLDVYLYYGLTFILPVIVGWYKHQRSPGKEIVL